MNKYVYVKGMHGMGDNIHQRALIRQWLKKYDTVYLESSWVSIYWDLLPFGLKIVRKGTTLRTQMANADREAKLFENMLGRERHMANTRQVWYPPADVRSCGGVLAAMCKNTGLSYEQADFSLPIKQEWFDRVDELIETFKTDKPILFYRPLVDRPRDWGGCEARNPCPIAYHSVFFELRRYFYVVSIADLKDGYEWITSHPEKVDKEFHKGELPFEMLAALAARSAMILCSPGFAVVLGQSVGTPVCCLFGTYEMAYSFSGGSKLKPPAKFLGIEPVQPRDSFNHDRTHSKSIDILAAQNAARAFARTAIALRAEKYGTGAAGVSGTSEVHESGRT